MKICKDCKLQKDLKNFYVNRQLKSGYMSRCKDCYKKITNNLSQKCLECSASFLTSNSEIKRGGGILCSRNCYYAYQKRTRPQGVNSWAWKGDKVGREALHNWVQKHLGKPAKCEHCKTTTARKYEWANISQKYKRDLKDWIRLCTKCHHKFDRPHKYKKWRKSVEALGWKVKIKK